MNHFELVLKIKDMAAYVLCVCVTAKGLKTNSFFFFFIYGLQVKSQDIIGTEHGVLYGTRPGSDIYLNKKNAALTIFTDWFVSQT